MKRLAAPKTWPIKRKGKQRFITRPYPRAPFSLGLPLTIILRDLLGVAYNNKEVEYLVRNKKVLVNGKPRKNGKFLVTLFDVISFPQINKHYRLTLGKNKKLKIVEINEEETDKKIIKIIRKQKVKGGKIQLTGLDSTNILLDNTNLRVGDSIIYNLKTKQIEKELPLKEGVYVYFYSGSNTAQQGIIKRIIIPEVKEAYGKIKKEIEVETENGLIRTSANNLIVVGEEKPEITIN
jgi:small subunit ribosomal protein S4e